MENEITAHKAGKIAELPVRRAGRRLGRHIAVITSAE